MLKNSIVHKKRLFLLSWLVVPSLILWLIVNYLIGSLRSPAWQEGILMKSSSQINLPKSINANSVDDFKWDNQALLTIWFDDAWLSQYKNAFPILEESGMAAALAVPTQLVGYEAYMNWAQIKRVAYKGWEITSHSKYHSCEMQKLPSSVFELEILEAKQELVAQGLRTNIYVAPCGDTTITMDALVKRHYLVQRLSEPGLNPLPNYDHYALRVQLIRGSTGVDEIKKWILDAKAKKSWLNLVFHQVDTIDEEYSTSPETFKKIITEIKNSGINVVLPSQVLNGL